MLTGETITDEQVRELRERVMRLCNTAENRFLGPLQRAARAECAALYGIREFASSVLAFLEVAEDLDEIAYRHSNGSPSVMPAIEALRAKCAAILNARAVGKRGER